jgi:hypothetical protein
MNDAGLDRGIRKVSLPRLSGRPNKVGTTSIGRK